MTTIKEFTSLVKSGGMARNNRYQVYFSLPPILMGDMIIGSNFLRTLSFYCDATSLPGVSFSTTQAKTYGEVREMPYERLFDNVNLSFYVDSDMKVKYLFDKWSQSIQNINTRSFNYYNEYTTDIEIFVQDYEDKDKYKIRLYECYPKSVSPINMEYAGKDVMKLQVSLNYKYWKSDVIGITDNIDEATIKFSDRIDIGTPQG